MHISIAGFPQDVEEEEIRRALEEAGARVRSVTMEPDSGGHTMAVVDVDTDETGARALAEAINGRMWRGRRLRARAFLFLK